MESERPLRRRPHGMLPGRTPEEADRRSMPHVATRAPCYHFGPTTLDGRETLNMKLRFFPKAFGLFALCLIAAPVRADDIKLKSGETLTEVEVVKKEDAAWTLKLLDGKTKKINPADIAEHVEKPTIAQEMDTKAKDLRKAKDVPGLIAVAKTGLEKGAKIQATKLLNEVLNLDKENEEAHKLLGHEKLGGKWLSGKAIDEFKAKAEGDKKKAMGWVEVGGKWVDPFTAKCMKAGLVEVEGYGYLSKDDAAKAQKGMKFVDGQWYDKADEAELAKDMRKDGGKWVSIADLNSKHKNPATPWVIESAHFEIATTKSLKVIQDVIAQVEAVWPVLKDMCGDAPVPSPGKKLRILIGAEGADYQKFGTRAQGNFAAQYSSSTGVFYHPEDRIAFTYYFNEVYLQQWTNHGAAHAFFGGIADFNTLNTQMLAAIGAYCEAMDKGVYTPWKTTIDGRILAYEFVHPQDEISKFDISQKSSSAKNETSFAIVGFVMHFLMSKYPDDVRAWMPSFLKKGASGNDLFGAIKKRSGEDVEAEFKKFVADYKSKRSKR